MSVSSGSTRIHTLARWLIGTWRLERVVSDLSHKGIMCKASGVASFSPMRCPVQIDTAGAKDGTADDHNDHRINQEEQNAQDFDVFDEELSDQDEWLLYEEKGNANFPHGTLAFTQQYAYRFSPLHPLRFSVWFLENEGKRARFFHYASLDNDKCATGGHLCIKV
ncbi:MAG: hypothetical protein MHM6MM_001685 [Cercozoa sp. M6MM]